VAMQNPRGRGKQFPVVHFQSFLDPKKVLLPPLHFKLGIMKLFVKALSKGVRSKAKIRDFHQSWHLKTYERQNL